MPKSPRERSQYFQDILNRARNGRTYREFAIHLKAKTGVVVDHSRLKKVEAGSLPASPALIFGAATLLKMTPGDVLVEYIRDTVTMPDQEGRTKSSETADVGNTTARSSAKLPRVQSVKSSAPPARRQQEVSGDAERSASFSTSPEEIIEVLTPVFQLFPQVIREAIGFAAINAGPDTKPHRPLSGTDPD